MSLKKLASSPSNLRLPQHLLLQRISWIDFRWDTKRTSQNHICCSKIITRLLPPRRAYIFKAHLNFQLVNKLSRISPHEVSQSWLINTVYHLLVKNNWGRGGEGRGDLLTFFPWKGWVRIRGRGPTWEGGLIGDLRYSSLISRHLLECFRVLAPGLARF